MKFSKILSTGLVALLVFIGGAAHASPMVVNFTASGSATGSGNMFVDSSMLAPSAFNCCGAPPPTFTALDLTLNFGFGNTVFHLADLIPSTYYVLSVNPSGVIVDINFWATNADGVTLIGVSAFHDAASGAMGANGVVVYTVNSITAAAVPAPGALALLGLGLFGIGGLRRKMKAA